MAHVLVKMPVDCNHPRRKWKHQFRLISNIYAILFMLGSFCLSSCVSRHKVILPNSKTGKGIILYYGDNFFLFALRNEKPIPKSVTWDYLYSRLSHTGYGLSAMHIGVLDNLYPHFRGIPLNVSQESVKNELKYFYIVPVNYFIQFIDTNRYKPFGDQIFPLEHMYNSKIYRDFGYKSYLLDSCSFTHLDEMTFSEEFSLTKDSMQILLQQLPPGIFREK